MRDEVDVAMMIDRKHKSKPIKRQTMEIERSCERKHDEMRMSEQLYIQEKKYYLSLFTLIRVTRVSLIGNYLMG